MKSPSARRPVFLDSTGRRHRAIRRAGVVLAVPVVGYLVLMTSSLFGGPRLDTPLVPLPEAIVRPEHRPQVTPPPAAIQTIEPSQAPTPGHESEPTGTPSTTPSGTPTTTPSGTPTPTVAPTTHTTGSPTLPPGKPTTAPTTTPTSARTSNRPTAPPGQTKTPGKP